LKVSDRKLVSKCPKCGTEASYDKKWSVGPSPKSKAVFTTYQFKCKKCGHYWRKYRVE